MSARQAISALLEVQTDEALGEVFPVLEQLDTRRLPWLNPRCCCFDVSGSSDRSWCAHSICERSDAPRSELGCCFAPACRVAQVIFNKINMGVSTSQSMDACTSKEVKSKWKLVLHRS